MNLKISRRTWRKLLAYGVFLLLLFIFGALYQGLWRSYERRSGFVVEQDRLAAELAELEERKSELERLIASLKTERGLEEEVRTKFQVSKPGEKTVILVEPDAKVGEEDDADESWWQWVKNLFDFKKE